MKKLVVSLSASLCLFSTNIAEASLVNKPGDIIVTNSTSSSGIVGHTGIYIDATHILHTSGWKSEPWPKVISETDWHKRYEKSKVIRPSSSSLGVKAAQKAKAYFQNKKIPYWISSNPTNISKTYCSELVWYAYYKAGKSFKTRTSGGFATPNDLVTPYNFIDKANVAYNKFSFIDSNW
ncbi:hypothetical protein [Priestia koreensis]|uniref:hypothetical protein n=1 Tax=Priestia koreensis TaxID=284581 RepID=UPI001F5A8E33|nr:hypothetical protein [Priestia koreensis]UNL87483.1 hypothetical protein IE339_24510 [Priestia koreensis]